MKVVIEVPGSTPLEAVDWVEMIATRADYDIPVVGVLREGLVFGHCDIQRL